MTRFIITASVVLFSVAGFSKDFVNCRSANGELQRIEKDDEDSRWEYNGYKVDGDYIRLDKNKDTKLIVRGDKKNGHYVIDVTLFFKESSTKTLPITVLCRKVSK